MGVIKVLVVVNLLLVYGDAAWNWTVHIPGGHKHKPGEGKPEEKMMTCELVKQHGYPCEIHETVTQDGYVLELHRIPYGIKPGANHSSNSSQSNKGKPVVFLQHGLVQSSSTWIINTPNMSLGYMLADRGYDVWMGNSRGNTYSRKHTMLSRSDELYWDFSWVEMAEKDLPAAIGFVLKETGHDQLNYIGHSQGTTQAFAAFSSNRPLARKIKLFIALAPVTHVKHARGLLAFIADSSLYPVVKIVIKALGVMNFMPNSWVLKTVSEIVCSAAGPLKDICANILFMITGYDTHNLDTNRLTVYFAHTPAGTSVKDILHFAQMRHSGEFQKWDYGWNGNMRHYMQPFPPKFYAGETRVPTAIFTGSYDWMSTLEDVGAHLRHNLPNMVYFKNTEEWNHMDFVWGITANRVVYDDVFLLLQDLIPDDGNSAKEL